MADDSKQADDEVGSEAQAKGTSTDSGADTATRVAAGGLIGGTDMQPFPDNWLGKGIPWADFLHMRMRLIRAFMDEGKSHQEIYRILSVDPVQVQLLMMTVEENREKYL